MSNREVKHLIIGAGFAGLAAAIKLDQAGKSDFVVIEKDSDVGGTWHVNTYPGAECDVPSQLYSYSFALNPDWSKGLQRLLAELTPAQTKKEITAAGRPAPSGPACVPGDVTRVSSCREMTRVCRGVSIRTAPFASNLVTKRPAGSARARAEEVPP